MTDNEIIKALEAESTPSELNCVHGEYIEACGIYCAKKHTNAENCHDCKEHSMAYYGRRAKATLALINRQKAEIERLQTEKDNLIRTYAECQAEAVKEFAEIIVADYPEMEYYLNELVKEFTEGEQK